MFPKRIAGRILSATVACCLFAGTAGATPTAQPKPAKPAPLVAAPPRVSAGAAILMDWRTGQVLYDKNAYARRMPASTTKVLTAIITLERAKLTDQVTISKRAAYTPGSSMYIKAGEVYSVHDLLHGLLLRSGNDAAVALAEHVAGSVEQFADLMNAKARQLGAQNSHFVNPHGLTAQDHYTTAYDLALITRYALRNETFSSIVSLRQTPLTYESLDRGVVLHNTNRLLRMLPEADGVKTGTTSAAGPCLIASATREDQKLVAVVLNDGNRWGDSAQLLDWGFDNFRLAFIGRQGEVLFKAKVDNGKTDTVPLALRGDLVTVMPRKGAEEPQVDLDLKTPMAAPLKPGQVVGKVRLKRGGQVVAEAELTPARKVPRRSLLDHIYRGLLPLVGWMSEAGMYQ